MQGTDWFWAAAFSAFRFAPHLLVGGVAVSRRQLHPRASKCAIVGFASLLVQVALGFAMYVVLNYESAEVMYGVTGIALAAIAAAIFLDRRPLSDE